MYRYILTISRLLTLFVIFMLPTHPIADEDHQHLLGEKYIEVFIDQKGIADPAMYFPLSDHLTDDLSCSSGCSSYNSTKWQSGWFSAFGYARQSTFTSDRIDNTENNTKNVIESSTHLDYGYSISSSDLIASLYLQGEHLHIDKTEIGYTYTNNNLFTYDNHIELDISNLSAGINIHLSSTFSESYLRATYSITSTMTIEQATQLLPLVQGGVAFRNTSSQPSSSNIEIEHVFNKRSPLPIGINLSHSWLPIKYDLMILNQSNDGFIRKSINSVYEENQIGIRLFLSKYNTMLPDLGISRRENRERGTINYFTYTNFIVLRVSRDF